MVIDISKDVPLRVVVLDVLKPHEPNIVDFGKNILEDDSVETLNISVSEVDKETESVKLVLSGKNIDFERVREKIESMGAAIHSIDKAVLGEEEIIEEPE